MQCKGRSAPATFRTRTGSKFLPLIHLILSYPWCQTSWSSDPLSRLLFPGPEDVHVTSRYHPATLNCWTIVLSSSYTVYTLFIPFHSLPRCRLGRPKVTLSSYSWWFVGSLDCFILLLHLQPRTMRKNDAPKISKMMRYHASKIFKFGSQISRQIQAASTDINELDVGKPDNELEGNGLEDEKSSSDEFSFLT